MPSQGSPYRRLLPALILIFAGGLLAWSVRTSGGQVEVRDVRFVGRSGIRLSALLFVPPGASRERPAPGILAVHGYINSRETQDGFAIELARRGHVVLSLDQPGHGYSDPPAFAARFGGPDGLAYLRSLDFVDSSNIGLEGHSMGGWAAVAAAAEDAAAYRSIALVGSSSGSLGVPPGTAAFPRNLGLIFSTWDEFSSLMWASPVGRDIVRSEKLQKQFGTEDEVEIGRLYGSIEEGTARMLYMPRAIHAQDHQSSEAIGAVIEWMQRTLQGGRPLPPSDQVWHWKELGTLLAFLGLIAALFPLGDLLLRTSFFEELNEAPLPARGMEGKSWWSAAAASVLIPILTYFALQNLAGVLLPPSVLFPQMLTTGVMVWALGNALVSLALFARWHWTAGSRRGATAAVYGLSWSGACWRRGAKSMLLALALAGIAHGLLSLSGILFGTDFRFWVLALKPLSLLHLKIALRYVVPFAVFFLVSGLVLHGQLRRSGATLRRDLLVNVALLCSGFAALLLVQYGPLLSGAVLPLGEPLLTILAFQFVPLLAIAALVSTYFFHRTGHVYVGACFNALFITWYIVAGQATHVAL
jgi:pimeloyl-ACP methyl ester carboxylesterase